MIVLSLHNGTIFRGIVRSVLGYSWANKIVINWKKKNIYIYIKGDHHVSMLVYNSFNSHFTIMINVSCTRFIMFF